MPELHRHDQQPQLDMSHDPGDLPYDPRPDRLKPDELKKQLETGLVGRIVPLLYRIYDARDRELITGTQAEDYLARLRSIVYEETGASLLEGYPDPIELERLFGPGYLGPEAVKATWGVEIPPHRLPPQPFTDEERAWARQSGLLLRLRIDRAQDGSPLTMRKMQVARAPALEATGQTLLFDTSRYQEEDFYLLETPTVGWALTSNGLLPNSTNKDLIKQIQLGIDFLTDAGAPLTLGLVTAMNGWDVYRRARFDTQTPFEIRQLLMGTEWKTYADELAAQPILRYLLPSATDLLFDHETFRTMTDTYTLPRTISRTRSRSTDGMLVELGGVGAGGASVAKGMPGDARGLLGLVLSCSL